MNNTNQFFNERSVHNLTFGIAQDTDSTKENEPSFSSQVIRAKPFLSFHFAGLTDVNTKILERTNRTFSLTALHIRNHCLSRILCLLFCKTDKQSLESVSAGAFARQHSWTDFTIHTFLQDEICPSRKRSLAAQSSQSEHLDSLSLHRETRVREA